MKRIISLLLIFILLFSLFACGTDIPPEDDTGDEGIIEVTLPQLEKFGTNLEF